MQGASSRIADISGNPVADSTSFTIPKKLDGEVKINDTGASVEIEVEAVNSSASENVSRDLGTIFYEHDGDVIALQGGGVWKMTQNGPTMVARPSLDYSENRLDLTLVDLNRTESLTKGEIVATRNLSSSRNATTSMMDDLASVWERSDVEKVNVTVTIDTQFADAWHTYAEENFEGNVTVQTVSDTQVEMSFEKLPATGDTATPVDISTISSSDVPPRVSPDNPTTNATTGSTSLSSSSDSDTQKPWSSASADRNFDPTTYSGSTSAGADGNRGGGNDCNNWDPDNPGETASDSSGANTASSSNAPWTNSTAPNSTESIGWCPEDENSGGGNDCNNWDPDNPNNANDARSSNPNPSSDTSDVIDEDNGDLVLNGDTAEVTYLGSQIGDVNTTDIRTEIREPLDVTFVLDESGSIGDPYDDDYDGWTYQETITDEGSYTVKEDELVIKLRKYGDWYEDDRYFEGDEITIENTRNKRYIRATPEGSDPWAKRIDATESFINLLNSSQDRASVVQFDYSTYVQHPLSSDLQAVKYSLEKNVGSGTDIAGGIWRGIQQYDNSDNERVMVLLSDGKHNNPNTDPEYSAEIADDNDITIYTVGLGAGVDKSELQTVADETDGKYYSVDDASGLEDTFEQIASDSQTTSIRAIDQNPVEMDVSLDGSAWTPGSGNLNDPTVVDPTDPDVHSQTFSITPGSTLDLTTTVYEPSGFYQSETTQTNGGTDYVHRGSGAGQSEQITDYTVYRDGDALQQNTDWWQQDAASLLDDVSASMNGNTVSLADDQALVKVDSQDGYSLLLVEVTGANEPPVPDLWVSNAAPTAGREITANASESSDPDGQIDAYKFGDRSWQSSPTTTLSVTEPTNLTLTVRDDDGATATTSLQVNITNRPVIANLTTSDMTVFKGEQMDFDASNSRDPDQGDSVHKLFWSSNVNPSHPNKGEYATATFGTENSQDNETELVELEVESTDDSVANTTLAVDVVNREPVANLTVNRSTVYVGETVELDASDSSDPDPGETVDSYDWSVTSSSSGVVTTNFTSPGQKVVEVTVESSDGSETTTNLTVDVEDRLDATVNTTEFVYKGEDLNLTVDSSGSVSEWQINGTTVSNMSGANPSVSWDTAGTRNVTAIVENGSQQATPSVDVEVRNREPFANLSVNKSTVYSGETVELDASNSTDLDDPDSIDTYNWNVSSDPDPDSVVTLTVSDNRTVEVEAVSTDGTSTTTSLDITVNDRLDANLTADEWVYKGDDPDIELVKPALSTVDDFEWRVDTNSKSWSTSTPSVSWNAVNSASNVTKSVEVELEDGSDTVTPSVEVDVVNREPAADLWVNETTVYVNDTVTLNATDSFDPDPSETIVDYDWNVSSSNDGEIDHSFSSNGTKNITVTAKSSDGTDTTASVQVDVKNRNPNASLWANKTRMYEGETVALNATNSSVPGGSIASYNWKNVNTSSGTTANASFPNSGTQEVEVEVVSATGTTETISRNITVNNRKPVANLSVEGTNASGAVAEFDASGSYDLDEGDSPTIDSFALTQQAGSGATLNTSGDTALLENVTESGLYRVEVTVADDDGATATTGVSINVGLDDNNAPVGVSVVEIETENE